MSMPVKRDHKGCCDEDVLNLKMGVGISGMSDKHFGGNARITIVFTVGDDWPQRPFVPLTTQHLGRMFPTTMQIDKILNYKSLALCLPRSEARGGG